MDVAVQKYPELVKKYFMTQCVPINDHKFVMLHAAVWSGGTFIYVPENVAIDLPLQAYFRMNAEGGGQFEHTLIIADKGSKLHYIEGCSAPRYNKNALHAGCVEIFVHENALVSGSKAQADGDDVRFWLDGVEQPRTLVTWNTSASYAWIIVPLLLPGETITYDMVYGNPSAPK
jgi:Fe-S cluster assembly scaffold protein SufB